MIHKVKRQLLILVPILLAVLGWSWHTATTTQAATEASYFAQKDDTTETKGPRVFVSPHWVDSVIKGKTDVKDYRIFEASYGNDKQFKKGHIPGAVHINTNDVESEANQWNLVTAKKMKQLLLKNGVTHDTTLIVYSTDISAACRVAFAALWTGVDNIKVVDGGYAGWQKDALKIQKGAAKKVTAAKDFGVAVPAHPEYEIKTPADFKKQQKQDPKVILASTRSWKEFTGKTSGYSYIKAKGEPKGAVYTKASKTSSDVAYLVHKDGTVKTADEVAPAWAKWGVTKDSNIDFYCGTGWRATVAFFITYQAEWQNVHVFDGGWYAWDKAHQKQPKRYQVQVGDPRSDDVKILK